MTAQPKDYIQWEFEQYWLAWFEQGGLDSTGPFLNESWERVQRQTYCPHQKPRNRCEQCRKPAEKKAEEYNSGWWGR